MANAEDKKSGGVLQATEQDKPYLASDPSAMSLAYLARVSSEVYGENETMGGDSRIIEIGADRFTIREHKPTKTLFVAICGTSSPLQHVMNVMPHAFKGLQLVEKAFSTKDLSSSAQRSSTIERDAYEEGHEQGWKVPASNIYDEVLRICASEAKGESDAPFDLNETYDRIVFTGHSRGGLLAYHAGVFCLMGNNSQPPYKGSLGVVGFGMPPPLAPPTDPLERSACIQSVLSVFHTHDPVSNGSVLKFPNSWNPAHQISLTMTAEQQQERARKREEQQAMRSSVSSRGSGFWGAVGNIVQTAVTAVGDTATDLTSNIEKYHAIGEYVQKVVDGHGTLKKKNMANPNGGNIDKPAPSFAVEKRDKENEWVLVFPDKSKQECVLN